MNTLSNKEMIPHSDRSGGYVVTSRGLESQDAVRVRTLVRQQIETIADTRSREGVLADVLSLILVNVSQLAVSIAQAKTLADIKAAAQPVADTLASVDSAVKNGSLVLPYMVKPEGVTGVLADMTTLSNEVSAILVGAEKSL